MPKRTHTMSAIHARDCGVSDEVGPAIGVGKVCGSILTQLPGYSYIHQLWCFDGISPTRVKVASGKHVWALQGLQRPCVNTRFPHDISTVGICCARLQHWLEGEKYANPSCCSTASWQKRRCRHTSVTAGGSFPPKSRLSGGKFGPRQIGVPSYCVWTHLVCTKYECYLLALSGCELCTTALET